MKTEEVHRRLTEGRRTLHLFAESFDTGYATELADRLWDLCYAAGNGVEPDSPSLAGKCLGLLGSVVDATHGGIGDAASAAQIQKAVMVPECSALIAGSIREGSELWTHFGELALAAEIGLRVVGELKVCRRPLDIDVACPTCSGGGWIPLSEDGEAIGIDVCETCGGRGLVPHADLVDFASSRTGRRIRQKLVRIGLGASAGKKADLRGVRETVTDQIRSDISQINLGIGLWCDPPDGEEVDQHRLRRLATFLEIYGVEGAANLLDGLRESGPAFANQCNVISAQVKRAVDAIDAALSSHRASGPTCDRCRGTGVNPAPLANGRVGLAGCRECEGSGDTAAPTDDRRMLFRDSLKESLAAVNAEVGSDSRCQSAEYLERLAACGELWLKSRSAESRQDLLAAIKRLVAAGFEGTTIGN